MPVQQGLRLYQFDISTAFLNGELEEEVHMTQPECLISPGKQDLVYRPKKRIYGLKQSPRCWNTVLEKYLKMMGLIHMTTNSCIYRGCRGESVYLGVDVDNIIIATRSDRKLAKHKRELTQNFDIKDMDKLHHFLV